MKTANLMLAVTYDENKTSAERVAEVLDQLLQNALSTDGVLDEVGNPEVEHIETSPWESKVE